ncbi:low temperature requirement protein A, partial [Thioclava sp. BHET1]
MSAIRPMLARDPAEHHRVATQLELFFDLVSVIAIAAVTETLHHGISAGHGPEMLVNFVAFFVAIWWAWMNYTWFASAFDNGDASFFFLTLVIMAGALLFAGGVESITESFDFGFAIIGWIVMRIGMIALWLRAALANPDHRRTALRYAAGIAVAQILWTALYLCATPGSGVFLAGFALVMAVELSVPVFAERATVTPWHRHHIIERYGLLNIIVLGEVLTSIALIFGKLYEGHSDPALVITAISGLLTVFCLWWIYFLEREHLASTALHRAILWGYGHVLVFASGALVAAGLGAVMDVLTHHSEARLAAANGWVAGPVAGYLFGLWFIRDRFLPGALLRRHGLLLGALVMAGLAVAG